MGNILNHTPLLDGLNKLIVSSPGEAADIPEHDNPQVETPRCQQDILAMTVAQGIGDIPGHIARYR